MIRAGILLVMGACAQSGMADESGFDKERREVMRRKLEATVLPHVQIKELGVTEA